MGFLPHPSEQLKKAGKCPHCGNTALLQNSRELRRVCGVCGGPRIELLEEGFELSGDENRPLETARMAQKSRAAWRAGGAVAGVLGGIGLLGSAIAGLVAGFTAGAVATVVSLPFVLLAITAATRSGKRSKEVAVSFNEAWRIAARDVVLGKEGGMTAQELSRVLPLSASDAEQLLTELTVDNTVTSQITADGQLNFAPSPRLRIAMAKTLVPDDESALAAEIEALAAEHNADPLKQRR
jgi:ribosomal protein S27AE